MATNDDSLSHESQEGEESVRSVDLESVPKLPDSLPPGMVAKLEELKTVSSTLWNVDKSSVMVPSFYH